MKDKTEGKGGTRKIADFDNIKICRDSQHNPAMHRVYEPGIYEHECPSCGQKQTFIVSPKPILKADVNESEFKKKDFAMVFDANTWTKGGGDVGDNSQFWKRAEILKIYWHESKMGTSDWVVDVKFEDGRVSTTHFLNGIKHCQ